MIRNLFNSSFNSSKESIFLKAPAKINLYLNILGKRRDGYHDICSIVERISLFDEIEIVLNDTKSIRFFCNIEKLNNSQNLAVKSAELLRREYGIKEGFDIFLNKKIPVGSGLGGASSDAATVLLALNKLLRLKLTLKELYRLGKRLGSDVNFFLSQAKFALILGRGEEVYPLKNDLLLRHILILPNFSSSTKWVYEAYNLKLTTHLDNVKLMFYSLKNRDKFLLEKLIFNALTKPYLRIYRQAREIFGVISQKEGYYFSLTGSGSAIFILNKEKLDKDISETLRKLGVKFLEVTTF